METFSESRQTVGGRAWELMYDVFRASKPYLETIASSFDLTPQQVFAMKALGEEGRATMSAFATSLGCDASNVTSIIDKLESRGLVERRSSQQDRRVKLLMLTAAGTELRNRISDRMSVPPPAIANLSPQDQEALCALFLKALDSL